MIKKALLFFAVIAALNASSQNTLNVQLNKANYEIGDSIIFSCTQPELIKDSNVAATLNVWIENIISHKKWFYRYPMLKGMAAGQLIISDLLSNGDYAMNFVVQRSFFSIDGKVADYSRRDGELNYIMFNKDGSSFTGSVIPAPDGVFRVPGLLFENEASFVFTPSKKNTVNELDIEIVTQLDSTFSPYATATKLIHLGEGKISNAVAADYHFSYDYFYTQAILPKVIVKTKKKTEPDEPGETVTANGYVFDGLKSKDIANSTTIYQFLQARIPGLMVSPNGKGGYIVTWRRERVSVFQDRFRVTTDTYINTQDIAKIRVYMSPSGRGSISVTMKKGSERLPESKGNHRFEISGYTPAGIVWR